MLYIICLYFSVQSCLYFIQSGLTTVLYCKVVCSEHDNPVWHYHSKWWLTTLGPASIYGTFKSVNNAHWVPLWLLYNKHFSWEMISFEPLPLVEKKYITPPPLVVDYHLQNDKIYLCMVVRLSLLLGLVHFYGSSL